MNQAHSTAARHVHHGWAWQGLGCMAQSACLCLMLVYMPSTMALSSTACRCKGAMNVSAQPFVELS